MVGKRAYDLMYRYWAPWEAVGVRDDLRRLVETGTVDPRRHPRAIDLGCGTGANVVYLAEQRFEATGVDFSTVALEKARTRAAAADVSERCHFINGNLTAPHLEGVDGTFDLLLDFGALDDLDADGRAAMAANITRLARRGALVLFWCFFAPVSELPLFSLRGPSRLAPAVAPGEPEELFGADFDIEPLPAADRLPNTACFLLTRR